MESSMEQTAFECPFCTSDDLETAIKGSELPVLAVFLHKKLSVQEQMLGVRGLCRGYCDKLLILGLTVETYGMERVRYNICNYPTYILFHEGHELGRLAGAVEKAAFSALLQKAGIDVYAISNA